MIAVVAAYFARKGLASGPSRKLAIGVLVLAACALAVLFWSIWLHFHDKAVIRDDRLRGNVEQLEDQVAADTVAADQRLADAAAHENQMEAYEDAIEHAHPGDSADPDIRLFCEQLRRDGQDTTGFPACGGR